MMSRWPSPAKLNLFLYITGQRADGYHTLQTLFQFLDYGDTLTIEPRADGELRQIRGRGKSGQKSCCYRRRGRGRH